MYVPRFAYPFIHQRAFGLLSLLTVCVMLQWTLVHKYLTKTLLLIPRVRIAGSYGYCISNFLRNCHIVFHSGCTTFYIPISNAQRFELLHILTKGSWNQHNEPQLALKGTGGTFLVAQWLRLRAPSAEGQGLIPGGGTRPHMQQLRVPVCVHAPSQSRVRLFVTCSLPGSSVHGISQARTLEWGCCFLFQGILPTQGSNLHLWLGRRGLYHWATWEIPRVCMPQLKTLRAATKTRTTKQIN